MNSRYRFNFALSTFTVAMVAALLVFVESRSQTNEVTVHVPVLAACESDVSAALESMPTRSSVTGQLVLFDDTYLTHSEVIGFVRLASSELSQKSLLGRALGFVRECQAMVSHVYSKGSELDAQRLFEFLSAIDRREARTVDLEGQQGTVDTDQVYLRNETEAVRVYFNVE